MNRSEREQRNTAMKAFKAEGHSFDEVAERFGVSRSVAQQVTKGIAPQTQRRPKRYVNQYTADTEKAAVSRLKRIEKIVAENAPGFEYVGGYTDQGGTAALRCKTCGHIETRSWNTIRTHKANGKKMRCPVCWQAAIDARKKQEKKKPTAPLVLPVRSASQLTFTVCKECGAVFIPHRKGVLFCSKECSRKEDNRKSSRRKDWRLLGKIVDRDIDLRDLARMSGDVCALCGKAVDWNDYEVRENGVIVCGNYYPSIDHIVPVSGDGLHAWGNVQLAHRICNTRKGATLPMA